MKAFGVVFPGSAVDSCTVLVAKLCRCFVDLRFQQTGSATTLVTKAWRCNLGLVVLVVSREACLGPPTASLRGGTDVWWGVLAGRRQCATESRMTLWQSANPMRAVGASPGNFVSACERVCELVLDGVSHL